MKSITIMFVLCLTLLSCQSTRTALYDQYSYQQTTAIKAETAMMMDKATSPYGEHQAEVEKLLLEVNQLVEYEKNKPNNEVTYAMWQTLTNKEKNLLAGFFKRWQEKGSFSPMFLEESKKQVMEALDLLIQYEIRKDKESKNSLLNLISK